MVTLAWLVLNHDSRFQPFRRKPSTLDHALRTRMRLRASTGFVFLVVAVAGCLGDRPPEESSPAPTSPDGTAESSTQTLAPASDPPREVKNSTYTFPRNGSGSNAEDAFDVPENYASVELRYRTVRDCPAGYYGNPRLLLEPPNGTTIEIQMFANGATGETSLYNCSPTNPTLVGAWTNQTTDGLAGKWTLRTVEECTCRVEFAAIAFNPSAD